MFELHPFHVMHMIEATKLFLLDFNTALLIIGSTLQNRIVKITNVLVSTVVRI